MSQYQFTKEMDEISGFGGGYEKACRDMVIAGVEWIDKHKKSNPKFSSFKNVYGIINEENDEAKELTKVMLKASGDDCTGAMMQATVGHVLFIAKNGWDEYVKKMKKQ